ncbi:MAG: helix-turn-helix transcriptional regulator [Candidatus Izemoplasmatales bacterium]
MNRIQDNIKRLRKDKGWTQEEVAGQLYVTRQLVSKWEMGKSLPNVADVERLAAIFGVGVGDLLDDESIRSITLSEAIVNRRKRRFHWISIPISLAAIGLGLFVLFSTLDLGETHPMITVAYCYVTAADAGRGTYVFENDAVRYAIDTIRDPFAVTVVGADGTDYDLEDLVVGDNVQVSFESVPENGLDIVVLDKVLETELYGVFVSAADDDFESLEDVAASVAGVRYVYQTESSSGWNAECVLTPDAGNLRLAVDVYVDLDPLKIAGEARIGLIRSDGIVIPDVVDLESQRLYVYDGAYMSGTPDVTTSDTVRVTYRIHVRFVPSVDSFTVYEYDPENVLIGETAMTWEDVALFTAQDDTLRAYVVTERTVVGGPYGTNILTNAYALLRGETETFAFADDRGMVRFVDFTLD